MKLPWKNNYYLKKEKSKPHLKVKISENNSSTKQKSSFFFKL